ncbi:hypothetical protein G3480_16585 [Thiorhodococcus mannitoliphagus]|uniref:Uncharacterized protein n=1 Tax=Thiorhodococcus mannitoliphagus TaxID=329406 RepID=A0A6P1E2I7_9GAMM|nr:hypothetical protein [Thiorhodococcus mannitoliphagus]NEX21905.1 hypothetical protein [Thiorhodococcus mannitoliphagus]
MKRELIFHISTAAGIQLRTVQRLKQIGILTTSRSFRETPDGKRYLVLDIQGADVPDEMIWTQVAEVQGILGLVESDKLHIEPSKTDKTQKQATAEFAPESGDTAIRDRMLIFSLLSRYPRLDGRFNEILMAIPPENRRQRALELGAGFGGHLARQIKPKKTPTKLADSMTELLIPALAPMATLRLDGNTMTVSDNRIDLKGKGHLDETCDFLKGTISGLLRAYDLASLFVGNQCRNDSEGEHCLFLFASKPAA